MSGLIHTASAGFEAARSIRTASDLRRCLHGHSFLLNARWAENPGALSPEQVRQAVAPLDYADLNQALAVPDDAALLAQLASQLPGHAGLWLRSAPDRGVICPADGSPQLHWLQVSFEAAHQLPNVPAGHQCGRLHGHGFGVTLCARNPHAELEHAWQRLRPQLHQRLLNDIPGLANPTSEVLSHWLWQQLTAQLALDHVIVRETATAGSQFNGRDYRIWKTQRFEAATPFDAQGRYTGHSYSLRLHLAGALDQVMGWVLDFGDVKTRFKPFYQQLDHHPLDQVAGLADFSCAGIARWAAQQLQASTPELVRVDVCQRPGEGALYQCSREG